MCEILAHAPALLEECLHRCSNLRRFRVELEVPVYFSREVENSFQHRTAWREHLACIVGEFPAGAYALRTKNKLVSIQPLFGVVAGQRLDHGFPGRRRGEARMFDA